MGLSGIPESGSEAAGALRQLDALATWLLGRVFDAVAEALNAALSRACAASAGGGAVLELAAMNIGTFAFLDYAEGRGFDVQYVHEFVDNEAAEFVADRGKPRAPAMEDLLGRRYEAFWERGIFAAASRIASHILAWVFSAA